MRKYYFVYCRKTQHQISKAMKYRRCVTKLCNAINDSRKQYAVGSVVFTHEAGITMSYPRKVTLYAKLLPCCNGNLKTIMKEERGITNAEM